MDKDEALKILEDSKPSLAIRKTIASCLGEDGGAKVWNRSAQILSEITNKYPPFSKDEYVHTKGIFNASALYLSLKEAVPDKALELIETGMASYAKEMAKTFQRMVKIPLGRTIFLKGFAKGARKMFGETAGFRQKFYHADGKDLRFDVLGCPYVRYTTELGCPEIAHIFCKNDIYAYAFLKGIVFERSETLGTGGTRCDFHLYKVK